MPSSSESRRRLGEFELIAKLFAPLACDFPGAFGLMDDVALLAPSGDADLVLKTDSSIESVHFLSGDPPFDISRKALRRALSDLAAKGAEPLVYLLALALPDWPDMTWLESFAEGLAQDQSAFGIRLAGGETNATPGPVTITVTAIGRVPQGLMIRRAGARPGDDVYVTGTIGDAGAGLVLARGDAAQLDASARDALVARYRLPEPRLAFGKGLLGLASAALDVSDGLLADLGHIADVSGVGIEIDADRIPISPGVRRLWPEKDVIARAATAGDDYEIAFTAPKASDARITALARETNTRVSRIGRVVTGRGSVLRNSEGRIVPVARTGHRHF